MPELADRANLVASQEPNAQKQKDARVRIALNSATNLPVIPPDVLWAWLDFYYRQTGQWLLPPAETADSKENQITSHFSQDSLDLPSSKMLDRQTNAKAAEDNFSSQAAMLAYQFPIPSMLSYAPIAPAQTPPADKPGLQITNYNYVESIYFRAAQELIKENGKKLSAGSQVVLSLIIAWSKFPLFNNEKNRHGDWITLSIAQIARELKIRTSNLKLYIEELESNGFIETGTVADKIITRQEYEQLRQDCSNLEKNFGVETASLWKPRAIQEKTLFYRLKIAKLLNSRLPVFNPFTANLPETERLENKLELHSEVFPKISNITQDVKPNRKTREFGNNFSTERQQSLFSSPSGTFLHEHDSNHVHANIDKNKILNLKHDSPKLAANTETSSAKSFPEKILSELTDEQKLKFDFLNNYAVFANFSRSDGRTTLDSQQAFKFALDADLSLERIKELYNLVKTSWEKGECRKNPLGLLHWSLSRNCEPFINPQGKTAKKISQYAIVNPMFHVNRHNMINSPNTAPVRLSQPKKSRQARALTQSAYKSISQNRISDTAGLFEASELEPTALWSIVLADDLAGRFRFQPEQLQLLEDSRLELASTPDNRQATVFLRSELEERQLNMATRNTIELALRQRLGSGYRYVFQAASAY